MVIIGKGTRDELCVVGQCNALGGTGFTIILVQHPWMYYTAGVYNDGCVDNANHHVRMRSFRFDTHGGKDEALIAARKHFAYLICNPHLLAY